MTIVFASLFSGLTAYFVSYYVFSSEINGLKTQISELEQQFDGETIFNSTNMGENAFLLSELFNQVRLSVVIIESTIKQVNLFGRAFFTERQGSGFVLTFNGEEIIVTSYHIVENAESISVTFVNGTKYDASISYSNSLVDLAFIDTDVPKGEHIPLEIVSSSSLKVGNPVIVVGTPYGLEGSMSEGIISALNRTLIVNEDYIGNVIQTTAPINPGNSGGPLLNSKGKVVGIVTARVADSEGIGFAIPSNVILENLGSYLDN
ncbi:MAG: S1C family serine protease [Promethearchaeota archaeon]